MAKAVSGILHYIDELVQERRNSSALAMELCLSYTNPMTCNACIELNRKYWKENVKKRKCLQLFLQYVHDIWGQVLVDQYHACKSIMA